MRYGCVAYIITSYRTKLIKLILIQYSLHSVLNNNNFRAHLHDVLLYVENMPQHNLAVGKTVEGMYIYIYNVKYPYR